MWFFSSFLSSPSHFVSVTLLFIILSFTARDTYIGYTDDPCMHHSRASEVLASSSDVVITTENKIYSRIFLDFFHGLTLAPSRWSSIIFRRILLVSVFISLSLEEVVICFFVVIRTHTTHSSQRTTTIQIREMNRPNEKSKKKIKQKIIEYANI